MSPVRPDSLPPSTYLLTAAQALNLTSAVIAVTVAAVLGTLLAPSLAWGTVPYGLQFAAMMVCTYPASMLMRRFGRRPVFLLAALLLVAAGGVGYAAAHRASFSLLMASHALLGAFMAGANFFRFAAVDHVPPAVRPRAMSWVVAGGVLAGVLGPYLASTLRQVPGHVDFALCYGVLCLLGVVILVLMLFWRPAAASQAPAAAPVVPPSSNARTSRPSLQVTTAIFVSAAAYLMMNLLMIESSLVMKDLCSFNAASQAIQAHVLAMFVPSFFTGRLITAFGLRSILLAGFALLAAATGVGLLSVTYEHIVAVLLLVGLGWNFVFIAGGALLSQCVAPAERHRWQGINDTVIAACATAGAFLPAPLLGGIGWSGSNLLLLPLCAAGAVLSWTALRAKGPAPEGAAEARPTAR